MNNEKKILIINFDTNYSHALYILNLEKQTKNRKRFDEYQGKTFMILNPADVPNDGKLIGSESAKIINTETEMFIPTEFIHKMSVGEWSSYVPIWFVFPNDSTRLPYGAKKENFINNIFNNLIKSSNLYEIQTNMLSSELDKTKRSINEMNNSETIKTRIDFEEMFEEKLKEKKNIDEPREI